jgi:UDPglucose 6-dehydrogenase
MREASSLVLAARLQAAGARVRAYDPVAEAEARKLIGLDYKASATEVAEGADAVVLVTEWREFAELDLAALAASMRGNLLVDGRNFLEPDRVREAGLLYEGVGRPSRAGEPIPLGVD